jgi:hypothetical protein
LKKNQGSVLGETRIARYRGRKSAIARAREKLLQGLRSGRGRSVLGGGTKSGYTFSSVARTGTPTAQYDTNAAPLTLNVTGVRYFYSNETGVIRGNIGGDQRQLNGGTKLQHGMHGV